MLKKEEAENAIARDLASLGVKAGDTLMVHSSLKSLGPLEGGPETVALGILKALGPEGTLLMPALTYLQEPFEVHDARTTPVCVGAVPEYFRTRPGTARSLHPTHSVCGAGRLRDAFLSEHWRDDEPCGPKSPFRLMTERGGKLLMLGCGLKPNTTMHAIEAIAGVPYIHGDEVEFSITGFDGASFKKSYKTHGFKKNRLAQRYDRVELLHPEVFRKAKVLEAVAYLIDAAKLRDAALHKISSFPYFFVDKEL